MTSLRSFAHGRDILLLRSALGSAERSLQQEDTNLNLFSSDQGHCRISALTVSNKIQNAYTAETDSDVVSARLHAAVFANVLLSSNIVADTELEYFESVLDDFPRIGWPFFTELVSSCGWRKYFLQSLKALPSRIRLAVLEAISDISKTMPYIWSCATSALLWSSSVEPMKEFTTSHDETLSALSKIQGLPLSDGISPTAECLLECCVQSLVCLLENRSLSDSEVADWASSLLNVVLDFVQSILEPTEFSLFNPDLWVVNYGDLGKAAVQDFYVVPLCCCRVVSNLSWPDICQLLSHAHSLLFSEVTKALMFCCGEGLIQEQKTKHALCSTHGFCAASLVCGSENELTLKRSMPEDLWHLIKRLQCLLNLFESINQEWETRSPLLACLKNLIERWVTAEVNVPAEHDEEALISNVETFLRQVASPSSEFIVWILSHENCLKHQWSCDKLNSHLNLLSHPELFPHLCQVALRETANDCVKKLVLKTCSAAPPKLQEAMLFYMMHSESFSRLPTLKLADFESRLTKKLNVICDTDHGRSSESTEQVLSDFASLCMESPMEVIQGLVDLAVTNGSTTAVAELLVHLRVVCEYKKCPEAEQDVLGSFLLEAFENLVDTRTSKHHNNYVHLIEELVKSSNIVNCDWLLVRIIRYIELAGASDPHPEDFFSVRVFMAIAPKMSKHYIAPMAQMLVQMLDKACLELNGARKEKVLRFLQAYIDIDDSWTTQGVDLLCGVGLSCAAIKCLFKKYPGREVFGAVTVHNFSEELLLLDAEQWRNECERIAAQFPQSSLCDLLMPHFCLWLAGATSEEWVILAAHLKTALSVDMGPDVSVVALLQQLLMCLIGCKTYIAVGNWSSLFTCFANTVLDCLKATDDLSEEDLQDILVVLLFGLTSLPGQCFSQQLLLLVDVTQRMKTSELREELVVLLQEALLLQCSEDGAVPNLVQAALRKLGAHRASQADV
ncbi:uncharacterized protein LOC144120853 isoform X1 [Amblyomma americanum]